MDASRYRGRRARKVRLRGTFALLAQLVEHFHGKEGVAGSSPAEGSSSCLQGAACATASAHQPKVTTRMPRFETLIAEAPTLQALTTTVFAAVTLTPPNTT